MSAANLDDAARAAADEADTEALDEAAAIEADALAALTEPKAKAAARKELGSLVEACVDNLANGRLQASDFSGARALAAARRGLLEATAGPAASTSPT